MARGRLLAKKSVAQIQQEFTDSDLRRTLGPFNLISLGIGAIIGAGIFVMTGNAAANFAGPARRAVVRDRGSRLHLCGAVLCRTRVDHAGIRIGVLVRLRHARRSVRLGDGLAAAARVRRRRIHRRGRLDRLRRQPVARLRRNRSRGTIEIHLAVPERRAAEHRRIQSDRGARHSRGDEPAGARRARIGAGQQRDRRDQGDGADRVHHHRRDVHESRKLVAVRAGKRRRLPLRLAGRVPRRIDHLLRVRWIRGGLDRGR